MLMKFCVKMVDCISTTLAHYLGFFVLIRNDPNLELNRSRTEILSVSLFGKFGTENGQDVEKKDRTRNSVQLGGWGYNVGLGLG